MRNKMKLASVGCLVCLIAASSQGDQYQLTRYTFSGGGITANDDFMVSGTTGQPDATSAMTGGSFQVTGGFWGNAGGGCAIADCADLDGDGIRDDGCVFWECVNNECNGTDIVYADMGGFAGACAPDGAADIHDQLHVLNCFANQDTLGHMPYQCEPNSPSAFNVDAAGLAAPCTPDGVCDLSDVFAVLNAFEGSTPCTCPGGPMPEFDGFETAAEANLVLRSSATAMAGDMFRVHVHLGTPLDDLRGYQLHVSTHGSGDGSVRLVDMGIVPPESRTETGRHVFDRLGYWEAYNTKTHQMMAGVDVDGIATEGGAYLATLVFQSSKDASGTFIIDVLHDHTNPAHRTLLHTTFADRRVVIEKTTPAIVRIGH